MQKSLNRQKLKHQGVSTPLVLNIYEKIEKLRIKKENVTIHSKYYIQKRKRKLLKKLRQYVHIRIKFGSKHLSPLGQSFRINRQ